MKLPQGKGFWIWYVKACEEGDFSKIVSEAKRAGLSHVIVKIADGAGSYNSFDQSGNPIPLVVLIQMLQEAGIEVYGYQYIYGADPLAEAKYIVKRCSDLRVNGLVVNAEKEFKATGMASRATTYMTYVQQNIPSEFPVILSSYRYPSYHPEIPWTAFRSKSDEDMPQVYWELAHNPAYQLKKSWGEFQGMSPKLPYLPTGSVYKRGILQGVPWSPTEKDVLEFMTQCLLLKLPGVNFWEWSSCKKNLPNLWEVIAQFNYPTAPVDPPADPIIKIQTDILKLQTDLLQLSADVKAVSEQVGRHLFRIQQLEASQYSVTFTPEGGSCVIMHAKSWYATDSGKWKPIFEPVDKGAHPKITRPVKVHPIPLVGDGNQECWILLEQEPDNSETYFVRKQDGKITP